VGFVLLSSGAALRLDALITFGDERPFYILAFEISTATIRCIVFFKIE
jgi:hypothetical protein